MVVSTRPHIMFWRWFEQNAPRLRNAVWSRDPDARQDAYDELRDALNPIQPGLILEFGPEIQPGRYELVASADGKHERVDAVKELVASAPRMPRWHLVAFRPRLKIDGLAIDLEDEHVAPEDVWFRVEESDDG